MKRIVASIWLGVLAAGALPAATRANNIPPLAFGMTPEDVATALGTTLIYVAGRPGSEVFVADLDAGMPAVSYPAGERIYLQFRRGGLTGWKKDWRLRKRLLPW